MNGSRRLRAAPRDPQRIESLGLYATLKEDSSGPFVNETDLGAVLEDFQSGVFAAANRNSTLHGFRAQNLFRGVALSLDSIDFIQDEDQGLLFFRGFDVKAPDFRVRAASGEILLVEVKNTRPRRPIDSFSISTGERAALRRFSELSGGGRSMVAIYWVWWNLWTLVDLDDLECDSGRASIDLPTATKKNKMALLGDRTFGTEWPLALTAYAELDAPRSIGSDGRADFTVARVEYSVSGRSIGAVAEQHVAHVLMLFGGWTEDRTVVAEDDGGVVSVRFELRPEIEPPPRQGFALHAPLSSIFSGYFNAVTLEADGEVRELDTGYSAMPVGALISEPYSGEDLRIWRFKVNLDG